MPVMCHLDISLLVFIVFFAEPGLHTLIKKN